MVGEDRDEVLDRALRLSEDVTAHVAGCSITEARAGVLRTTRATGDLPLALDNAQYDVDDGPCVVAAREGSVQRVDDMTRSRRFGPFARAAAERGVLSSLSVPLPGNTALNLYSRATNAFASDRATSVAALLARSVARLVDPHGRESADSALRSVKKQRGLIRSAQQLVM